MVLGAHHDMWPIAEQLHFLLLQVSFIYPRGLFDAF